MRMRVLILLPVVLTVLGCAALMPVAPTPTVVQPSPTFTSTPVPTSTAVPTPTAVATATQLTATTESSVSITRLSKQTGKLLSIPKGSTGVSVAWSKDGKTLFVGTDNSGLLIYDAVSGERIAQAGKQLQVQALALSPDGKTLAAGVANDGSIRLLSPVTGDLLKTLYPAHTNWPQVLAFSPDGKVLASAGDDCQILLWDVQTGTKIRDLYRGEQWIWGMAFSPDGRTLMAGFDTESTFRVWDTSTWQIEKTFSGDFAADLAFSPDGNKIVTAGGGIHEANLWNAHTGEHLFTLRAAQGWVWAVAYDPTGHYVVSGGVGNAADVWDADTGQLVRKLQAGEDFIQALAYSPDGTRLAWAGIQIIIWNVGEQ